MSRLQVRTIVHFPYSKGLKADRALKEIHRSYGAIVSRTVVFDLYKQFREGRVDMADRPRSGRPRNTELDSQLVTLVHQEPELTLQRLAHELGVSPMTISRRLKELHYRRRRPSGYVNIPTNQSREIRVESCVAHLEEHTEPSVLDRIITCDEKWVVYTRPRPQT